MKIQEQINEYISRIAESKSSEILLLPENFLSKMMPAIVGFEIIADKLEIIFKLSQNRDEISYLNIISKLKEQGGNGALIAEEMKKRKAELFPEGVEWDGSKFDS